MALPDAAPLARTLFAARRGAAFLSRLYLLARVPILSTLLRRGLEAALNALLFYLVSTSQSPAISSSLFLKPDRDPFFGAAQPQESKAQHNNENRMTPMVTY